jgi:hypothetical protein
MLKLFLLNIVYFIRVNFATPSAPFWGKALEYRNIAGAVCATFAAPVLPLLPLPTVLGGIFIIMSGTDYDVVADAS